MLKRISILVSLGIGLAACAGNNQPNRVADGYTAPYVTNAENQHNDDQKLQQRLQAVIKKQLPHSQVLVVVNNYNVLLAGQVATNGDKVTAANLCRKLPVVKKVYNYLTPAAQPKLLRDTSVSSELKDRLASQKDVYSQFTDVVAVGGVVYIMGTNVGNLTALQQVAKAGYTLKGVKKVIVLEELGEHDYTTQ
jgi:osmotically-inducible protein OsmY